MAKRLKILLVFISLSLTLCLMSNTYSRYVANTTGNLEVLFAKWQILINNVDITESNSTSISLIPVIEKNDYVASNTLAPSSKGYFDIDIDPTNVDVSFDYSINLTYENENVPDLIITKYSILDSAHTEDDNLEAKTLTDNKITGSFDFDKTKENFEFEKFTIRVYFEWYEGTDEQMDDAKDSELGYKAATEDQTFAINATISFEQKITTSTATETE